MKKIKNCFDDIVCIAGIVIWLIPIMIWLMIFICIPVMILGALCKLKLLSGFKCRILVTKLVNWWRKLLISPADEAIYAEIYDLAEKLVKNN